MQSDSKINSENPSPYEYEHKADYISDWDVHRRYITSFDPYEAILLGQVYDAVSNSIEGSKITDSYLATLAIDRAARVMGKLPDGTTEPTAKADQGKAAFMDILRQKWLYPNANAQHNFDTKLRLWQLYSSVYGYMPMFYDWNVSPSGYVGPDCWLWNPRNFIPQQGRVSLSEMDYVTALTWVGKKYIEDIIEDNGGTLPNPDSKDETAAESTETENKEDIGGWDIAALKDLLQRANDKTNPDLEKDTMTARTRTPQATRKGICLATRYEAGADGEWVTFAPDHGYCEVRRLKNPHKNGRIPFVIKYSQPLYDSFYGLGDFQRFRSIQAGRDGLRNFYFKGVKMNLIPPIVANSNGVIKHTLDYREGGVMLETIPNSIRRLETSNAGLSTYQAAMSDLTGSLLAGFGTQNAAIPGADALNPSQGKTPQAISLYSDKEATRDGQERMYLEGAIEELTDGFFSLLVNIGTEEIPVNLFAKDIEDIQKAGLTDIMDLFGKNFKLNATQTGGELKIDPASLKGVEYRFKIASGSTAKMNKDAIRQEIENLMGNLAKFQNQIKDDPTITINFDKIMAAYEGVSEIPGASEFITINPNAQPPQPPAPIPKPPSDQIILNYADARTPVIAQQIEQMFGLKGDTTMTPSVNAAKAQASQAPQAPAAPTPASTGHVFQNPHLAQVADAIIQRSQTSPEAPPEAAPTEPTVVPGGHSFQNPHIGSVASEFVKAAKVSPPAAPKEPVTTKGK
jgi:hypothetical protein